VTGFGRQNSSGVHDLTGLRGSIWRASSTPAQRHVLRAADHVVGDNQGGAAGARRRGNEADVPGAVAVSAGA
jgi:hypothetical protein